MKIRKQSEGIPHFPLLMMTSTVFPSPRRRPRPLLKPYLILYSRLLPRFALYTSLFVHKQSDPAARVSNTLIFPLVCLRQMINSYSRMPLLLRYERDRICPYPYLIVRLPQVLSHPQLDLLLGFETPVELLPIDDRPFLLDPVITSVVSSEISVPIIAVLFTETPATALARTSIT